jgi:FKBP-type peptidyl-prolyl cis-trans isomerase 2
MAKAKYGSTVKLHYTASLGDGTVLSTTVGGKPLQFTIGADHVIRDFEDAVVGMNEGEAKNTKIPGERMFGPYRVNNLIEIDRNRLRGCSLRIGRRIRIPGHRFSVKVIDVSKSKVILDANHPLSDRNLFFYILLLAIK